MSQYMLWSGGVAPVPNDVMVKVILRNGNAVERLAGQLDWQHTGSEDDVMRWRHSESPRVLSFPKDSPAPPPPLAHDPVNHPRHYTAHPSGVECIEITRHMGFNCGNAVKYIWRADLKNGIEDLEKAIWYLRDEIALRKGLVGNRTK